MDVSYIGLIHFIGIGGIGMSGIAELMHRQGYRVQGSDQSANANVKRLQKLGVQVWSSHDAAHVEGAQVIVTSTAVRADNVEVIAAQAQRIPIISRAEMLAELMRHKQSIAVAGSHGKTTTTSLVSHLLDVAQMDPTVVNGGIINAYGSNARLGEGPWMVVEADESDGSFLKLLPTVGIVTNVDPEHMDYYRSDAELYQAFEQFVRALPFYGLGILCADHPITLKMAQQGHNRQVVTYGFDDVADIQARDVHAGAEGATFDVVIKRWPGKTDVDLPRMIKSVHLNLVGVHNVQNALSVVAIAQMLGIDDDVLKQAFKTFQGVRRRFTRVGTFNGATVIDDYAHHPEEIRAVIRAAQGVCAGRLIAVVQPHRYSRLHHLFEGFTHAFQGVDQLIVAPVYSAGEAPIPGRDHEALAAAVRGYQGADGADIRTVSGQNDIAAILTEQHVGKDDMILCMGAGSITEWAADLGKIG